MIKNVLFIKNQVKSYGKHNKVLQPLTQQLCLKYEQTG